MSTRDWPDGKCVPHPAAGTPANIQTDDMRRLRLLPADSEVGWTPYIYLAYLAYFVLYPAITGATLLVWLATLAATVLFLALYFRAAWVRGRQLALIIGAITLLSVVMLPINVGAPVFIVYATALASGFDSRRRAFATIALIMCVFVPGALLAHVTPWAWTWALVVAPLVGVVNLHWVGVLKTHARLRAARDEIAQLAKLAERERIARDLHDLLGHTLTLIVVKAELANKLSERDPARARVEIAELERISRDALSEVRRAVGGYRAGNLQQELASARNALVSAGVETEIAAEEIKLSPGHEVVLSMVLREAVTNVIRHASARSCRVAVRSVGDLVEVEITDDGRGGKAPEGHGLQGMRERIEALGGTLTRHADRGTRLVVVLPASGAKPADPKEGAS